MTSPNALADILAQVIERADNGVGDGYEEAWKQHLRTYGERQAIEWGVKKITALRAASSPAPDVTVEEITIKPLEWAKTALTSRITDRLTIRRACTLVGVYAVEKESEYGYIVTLDTFTVGNRQGYQSIEEAQAAAQKNYEDRIWYTIVKNHHPAPSASFDAQTAKEPQAPAPSGQVDRAAADVDADVGVMAGHDPLSKWEIKNSGFGDYVSVPMSRGNMVVLCTTSYQSDPRTLRLNGQTYVKDLLDLADKYQSEEIRLLFCDHRNGITIPVSSLLARLAAPTPPSPKGGNEPALKADFAQSLPGGRLDDSTYQKIEDALDKIEAPIKVNGRWLALHERIEALTPAAPPENQRDSASGAQVGLEPPGCPIPGACACPGGEKELSQRLAAAHREIARLRERLEIDHAYDGEGREIPFPQGYPDGIACRDETIRQQDQQIAAEQRRNAELEAGLRVTLKHFRHPTSAEAETRQMILALLPGGSDGR